MKAHVRENYFIMLKLIITIVLVIYLIMKTKVLMGAPTQVLLLSAFFIASIVSSELVKGRVRYLSLVFEAFSLLLLIYLVNDEFTLLMTILIIDIISLTRLEFGFYLVAYLPITYADSDLREQWFIITTLIIIIYFQHYIIISSYKKQLKEDELQEQLLKKDMTQNESNYRKEISKSLLMAENSILEERSRLSQALHDKLGHSINGSVYQLEACKVLLEKEPKECSRRLEAVIDNLRTSMEEIREILRKEKPDKYKIARLQLQGLCEECIQMGIVASYEVLGNIARLPNLYLEIILDNAFEAVSNAMKYSQCTRIEIKILVMNQVVRCSIADNGLGCKEIVDGMGLSGMRKRVRNVKGVIDFESEYGFTINMLLPLESNQ